MGIALPKVAKPLRTSPYYCSRCLGLSRIFSARLVRGLWKGLISAIAKDSSTLSSNSNNLDLVLSVLRVEQEVSLA